MLTLFLDVVFTISSNRRKVPIKGSFYSQSVGQARIASLLITGGRFPQILDLFQGLEIEFPVAV